MSDIVLAQAWAIGTNIFFFLPSVVLWRHVQFQFEFFWFPLLALVSSMHHSCDSLTMRIWSCNNHRAVVSFIDVFMAIGGIICVVTPHLYYSAPTWVSPARLGMFSLLFVLMIVDTAGNYTIGVIVTVLVLLVLLAGNQSQRYTLFECTAGIVLVVVGAVLYVGATRQTHVIDRLMMHGSWHIPMGVAAYLFFAKLERDNAPAPVPVAPHQSDTQYADSGMDHLLACNQVSFHA